MLMFILQSIVVQEPRIENATMDFVVFFGQN